MAQNKNILKDSVEDFWGDITGHKPYHRYHEREDRPRRVAGKLLLLANIVAAIVYLAWFASVLKLSVAYISIPFFIAEIMALVTISIFAVIIWYPRFHDPSGIPSEIQPTVDIFITTAGEPLDILEPTVEAATRINYPKKNVYILDDSNLREVQKLAMKTGCRYLARQEHKDAKAGNLNHALAQTDGELVLTLDADQVPDPDIVNRLVGYFKFPYIAFVQTAQRFILPKGDPFGNSDELFYRTMQAGKDSDNAAFSCGSSVLYKRAALESVGGFSTWNLVEDVHTSMRLHSKGWRSIYHDHPLSTGTAPTDIFGVYKQRGQWATDSLRLLLWDSPFKQSGLNLKQKVQYFQIGYVYLVSAFIMLVYYITPSWSMLSGDFLIDAPASDYVIYRGIYLLFTVLAIVVLERPADTRKPYKMWAGLFPVFIQATFKALRSRSKKPSYVVTRKTLKKIGIFSRVAALLPQLGIISLTVFSIIYAIIFNTLPFTLLLINVAWSLWVIWTLSGICVATFKPKRMPTSSS